MSHYAERPALPAELNSTLVGVLSGADPQVVQRWHSARSVSEVADVVRQAGWGFGYLDSAVAQTKPEILAALGETLAFPDYYGRNLDALNDCLDDLLAAPTGPEGLLLLWDAWAIVAESAPQLFNTLLTIFAEHTGRERRFVVLLRDR